jgi:hypothetical protein
MNFRHFVFISILLVPHLLTAQSQLEDSMRLASAIEWLEDKLTYYYYNVDDDTWWNNRFTFNDGSKTITIKNIASPYPQAVTGKTYLELNFHLSDLDPYSIAVEERPSNAGRLVKGKTIRVGAFEDQAIKRSRNGRRSNEQSFIYFSVPDFFEDSIQNFSQSIADKLSLAVDLSTRIYPASTPQANLSMIRTLLHGRFKSEYNYWVFRQPFPALFELLLLDENLELTGKRYIKFLSEKESVEVTTIYPDEFTDVHLLSIDQENPLRLFNDQFELSFQSINQFTLQHEGASTIYIRDGTFDPLKARYR